MRVKAIIAVMAISIAVSMGCSKTAAPSSPTKTELAFKPKFTVAWPATPDESCQIIGDQKHYDAMAAIKDANGVRIFLVFVMEYPEKQRPSIDPKEVLFATAFAFQKDETSREEIEFGPKKYPGLRISMRSPKLFNRKMIVMADLRLYIISVGCTKEEGLDTPEVAAFLGSFSIDE